MARAEAEQELPRLLAEHHKQGVFTDAFVACGRLSDPKADYYSYQVQDQPDPVCFDLASLTKALATAPLIFALIQEKGLDPYAPLLAGGFEKSLPRLPEAWRQLCLAELLGHRSGLPAWWNIWMNYWPLQSANTRQERLNRLAEVFARMPLRSKSDLYSDCGYLLLGFLLECEHGRSLAELFSDWQTKLGMNTEAISRLGYRSMLAAENQHFATTGWCAVRQKKLFGEVHDENCASLGGIAGHAGLFGQGPTLVQSLRHLYQHPLGQKYWQANEEYRLLHPKADSLVGLRRGHGISAKTFAQGEGMGHLGFTGTAFWLHLASDRFVIFLSNRVQSGRVSTTFASLRAQVFHLLDQIGS